MSEIGSPIEEPYVPIVRIKDLEDFRGEDDRVVLGDRRDGKLYRYNAEIKLHVNVAVATSRPLLVLGPSGCGKSSLAFNLARVMGRRYYEFVVTSQSQARDLFYRFDAVRRLGDTRITGSYEEARGKKRGRREPLWRSYFPYIEPGPLWWIFDAGASRMRGYDGTERPAFPLAIDPVVWSPVGKRDESAVLLIDEIDKAELDFPNNLLVPLGSRQFILEEIARPIVFREVDSRSGIGLAPLIVITSNRERELPQAFIRRCVVLEIAAPAEDDLIEIAKAVSGKNDEQMFRSIVRKLVQLRGAEHLNTAEFLDAVQAITRLSASEPSLSKILQSTTWRTLER
jgi:MoxR-like ATPase